MVVLNTETPETLVTQDHMETLVTPDHTETLVTQDHMETLVTQDHTTEQLPEALLPPPHEILVEKQSKSP